jgi:EpsI family protein
MSATVRANVNKAWVLALCMAVVAALTMLGKPKTDAAMDQRAKVPLEDVFPSQFDDWRLDPAASVFVRPAVDQAKTWRMYDQVLERTYINHWGQRVMLSVAYGRQQSVGLQMHRPEVCYQADGFVVQGVQAVKLQAAGRPLMATRMVARMGGRPEPITYWRLLGNEVVWGESSFKLHQLSLGLRGRVLDGMLVRVSSIDPDTEGAYRLQAQFADQMARAMAPDTRQRVFGEPVVLASP